MDVAAELPASGARVAVVLGAAALASGFYALGGYATPLALLVAASAGCAGRGTFVLLTVFYQLSVEGLADGLVTVTLALAIGLALASGVTLGQHLTRPQATVLTSADSAPDEDPQ